MERGAGGAIILEKTILEVINCIANQVTCLTYRLTDECKKVNWRLFRLSISRKALVLFFYMLPSIMPWLVVCK